MRTKLPIEPLTVSDIPDCVELAKSVGWQDVESDWRVIHQAAVVLGARHKGALVAQGAFCSYDNAGTIAKMIVAPAFRRQGIASRLMERLIAEASARGIRVLGLVATAQGRPLNEQWRFKPAGDVVVFNGTPRVPGGTRQGGPLKELSLVTRLELRSFGLARTRMLGARLQECVSTSSLMRSDGELSGYVLATAQNSQAVVGPLIAETDAEARELASAVFRSISGPVRIDVPGERQLFREWLKSIGLNERSIGTEMVKGSKRLPWQVPQRFALAGQAWG